MIIHKLRKLALGLLWI